MTFLGLEQPVEYKGQQIFDPTTALMVLNANRDYINAVYNDYRLALADMKEFNKEYGDFLSPIAKDMEWYDKNVTGDVRNFINNLYAQGIDPLRSAEGRALVTRKLASMPTGQIALLRLSAEAAKEYIKNRGALEAAGKYNRDLEERFLGFNLNNWDTMRNGIWDRVSPIEAKSLKELTESSYNNRTAHDLTKEEVLSFEGQSYDPRMRYKGFTNKDLLNIANTVAPGLTGTPWNDYFRDLAAREVAASGKEVTDKNINEQLARNIANTLQEYLIKPIGDLDDWYKEQQLSISRQKLAIARLAAENKNNPNNVNSWTQRQQAASKNKSGMYGKAATQTFDEWLKSGKNKGMDRNGHAALNGYYESTRHTIKGNDKITAEQLFNAGGRKEKVTMLGGSTEYQVVSFSDPTLRPTRLALFEWAGERNHGGIKRFTEWLASKGIEGYSYGNEISTNHKNINGYDFYEINKPVLVKKEKIDPYFDRYTDTGKIANMDYLGLKIITKSGKVYDPQKGSLPKNIPWDDVEYVEIPSSRRIEATGWDNGVIDQFHISTNYGKGAAAKQETGQLNNNLYDDEED